MRIVTLLENTTCREDLACEHGLSLYIETKGKKILFDAGQSGAFADNAEKLGIDLSAVDFAVLSHGHYDHGGGLARFLQINKTAPIYLHRNAFGPHYNGTQKYIGLDPALRDNGRLVFTEGTVEISPGITLRDCAQAPLHQPIRPFGLCRMETLGFIPEDFRHEQYLLLEESGKRICISGCSHRGIGNILRWFRPDILVGGFHFQKLDPESDREALEAAAQDLMGFPTVYYTGHCTGQAQYEFLKTRLGDRLRAISTGTEFHL